MADTRTRTGTTKAQVKPRVSDSVKGQEALPFRDPLTFAAPGLQWCPPDGQDCLSGPGSLRVGREDSKKTQIFGTGIGTGRGRAAREDLQVFVWRAGERELGELKPKEL